MGSCSLNAEETRRTHLAPKMKMIYSLLPALLLINNRQFVLGRPANSVTISPITPCPGSNFCEDAANYPDAAVIEALENASRDLLDQWFREHENTAHRD